MKVTVIGLRGIPEVMGGVETHCQELYPRIAKEESIELTVITRKPYIDPSIQFFEGIKLISLYSPKSTGLEAIFHSFLALVYVRLKIKTDILHIHAIGPSLVLPLARLFGFKVVVTHHGADYNRKKWGLLASSMLRLGEYFAIKLAHTIICVGKSLTATLVKKRSATKATLCIPNGAPISNIPSTEKPNAKQNVDLSNIVEGPYILFVGRLVPEKGIDELIGAYKQLKPMQKLVIVGAADHESEYSSSILGEQDSTIIIAGQRTKEELSILYSHCDLFVLPSSHEGLPIVALEAMSYGCNILLSNIAPNVDIGLASEHYYPLNDRQSLVRAIENKLKISKSEDYTSLLQVYNWDKIALATTDVYYNLHHRYNKGLNKDNTNEY